MRTKLPPIVAAGGLAFFIALCAAFLAGVIRPPRPMFHEAYAAGGFGLIPSWQPNPVYVDDLGRWLYFDRPDNLVVVQATGFAVRSRSQAMTAGTEAARFRLGNAGDDGDRGRYARISRLRDRLVVILPDGRRETFPIGPGRAARIHQDALDRDGPSPDLLTSAASILGESEKIRLGHFLGNQKPN